MAKFKNPTTGLVVEQENRTPQDLANQGFVPVAETEPTISIDKLKTETPINITGIEESPIFPISSLDTTVSEPLKMGQEEIKAQGLTERLMELNKELTGESALRAEEETKVGLPELIKTQTDLSSRLKAIQAEEKAIPLQLQQESLGRGITTGGLQPLQTARLRENAIRALSVSSLLEASKGNITTAQDLADRAVAQKYEPIKAEINALTKNLDLIIKSPKYSLEDKNRAQVQLDIQNQKKLDLEKKEKDEQEIMKTATEAAKNGADSLVLDKISKATSPIEALKIATESGFIKAVEKVDTEIIESNGRKLLINTNTGETIKDLGDIEKEKKTSIQTIGNKQYLISYDDKGNVTKTLLGEEGKIPSVTEQLNAAEAGYTIDEVGKITKVGDVGSYGGQCGDYVHSIMSGTPKFGDTWQEKEKAMNTSKLAFSSNPQVGDIITLKTNLPYGHVAVVTAVNGDNITLTESNYNLDKKIGIRTISSKDPNILGAYRGANFVEKPQVEDRYMKIAEDIMKPGSNLTLASYPQKEREKIGTALGNLKENAINEGNLYGIMRASAGGAKLDSTAVKELSRMNSAIKELKSLKSEIDKMKLAGGTGPFKGRINEKKFWDTDIQVIKQKLTGIVPTIARGVFGEVGVLTDNDIALYKQTIPNIKNTDEAIDRIYSNLLDTIQTKILSSGESYANAEYDVSGFANSFLNLQNDLNKEKAKYLPAGELLINADGTYTYKNMDNSLHTGKLGDNYVDKTGGQQEKSFKSSSGKIFNLPY